MSDMHRWRHEPMLVLQGIKSAIQAHGGSIKLIEAPAT